MAEEVKLYLYTTSGCHLCEQAKELVEPLLVNSPFTLVLTEIADDDELMDKYGIRIPVLKREDTDAEIGWPFSLDHLAGFLN